ncbi:Pseudouridylate synthase 7-like [Gracilariopsis chorda]|uniref:Pseudouridylate synthase 7-like n=1 Tax=Gracilariopsis chorda TaxID=448386 RepID=A0A2V3J4F0_9FLOR|nr:Pseudouridylate synthase 7-like [Gracilariopsis chorda]|eukprot:PXF48250.1 Pseudouridylate synthase 7-like [Gracilariopsis chorda]
MPVTEADVAITERLSAHTPFRAVLKQSVHDFIVNEIASDNTVVALTRLPQFTPKRPRQTPPPQSAPPPAHLSVAPIDAFFPNADSPPSTALAAALAAGHTSHVLPAQPEKSLRKLVHEWIRHNLPSFATDTVQSDAAQAVRLRRRPEGRPRKRRRVEHTNNAQCPSSDHHPHKFDPREYRQHHPSDFPNKALVNFVLWKRNRDTTEALTVLAKALHRNVKHFSYAGTKDRRAVTTQLVQIRGIQQRQLAKANFTLLRRDNNRPSVLVGNPTVVGTGKAPTLRLGDLKGNRFTLVLRDFEAQCDRDVENALHSIRHVGFINYFGLQRFGSGVSPTHVTGFAVLRADFEDVCRRILLPLRIGANVKEMRPERQRFVLALEQFACKEISATQLLPQLAPFQRIERAVVASFADDESKGLPVHDYRKAFGKLPRFLRMMYGHAVQSFLWNIMASERIRLCRPDPKTNNMHAIAGDLVLETHAREAELSFKTKLRRVTEEEEEKKSVPVHHVFIPVVGSEVPLPSAKYAEPARKILQHEKIDLKSLPKSEFALKGTYRRLLALPKNVETKISSYNDVQEQIAPSSVARLVAELQASNRDSDVMAPAESAESREQQDDKVSVMKDEPLGEELKKENTEKESNKEDGGRDEVVVEEPKKEIECDKEDFMNNEQMTEESKKQEGQHAACRKEQDVVVEKSGAPQLTNQQQVRDVASEASSPRYEHGTGNQQRNDKPALPVPVSRTETNENAVVDRASEEQLARSTQDVTSGEEKGHRETDETIEGTEAITDSRVVSEDANAAKAESTVAKQPVDRTPEGKDKGVANEASNTDKKSDTTSYVVQDTKQMSQGKSTSEGKVSSNTEEIPNDQVEGANGHNVLEANAESDTKTGDDRMEQEFTEYANGSKNTSGNDETSRNEQSDAQATKKALVISFNLGCAEYATMLVRELTGHESSTAAQKALQESVQ